MGEARFAILAAALVLLSGCTKSYVAPVAPAHVAATSAQPAQAARGKRICVVRNPRVIGTEFLELYGAALEQKGYAVTLVDKNPQPSECPLTSRYTSLGDLVQVEIYRDGRPVGSAALRGWYSESSVRDLVNKLLP